MNHDMDILDYLMKTADLYSEFNRVNDYLNSCNAMSTCNKNRKCNEPVSAKPENLKRVNKWGVIPMPTKIIANKPATIVFFEDGTKQVVRCADDVEYSVYGGFVNACMVKMFENNTKLKKFIKSITVEQEPKKKAEEKEEK